MENLIIIKLGGSLITHKEKAYSVKIDTIKDIVKEIVEFTKQNNNAKLLIINGAGSYGHFEATKYPIHKGLSSTYGFCRVSDAPSRLNKILIKEMLSLNLNALSFQPSAISIASSGKLNFMYLDNIKTALKNNFIPVLHGDACFDKKNGSTIISSECIISYLAENLNSSFNIQKILLFGTTDGVYDEKHDTIKKINNKNFLKIKKHIKEAQGYDVTGGMIHKVKSMLKLSKKGHVIEIINGSVRGNILNSLLQKEVKKTTIDYYT